MTCKFCSIATVILVKNMSSDMVSFTRELSAKLQVLYIEKKYCHSLGGGTTLNTS